MVHKKCLMTEDDIALWKRQTEELGARQLDEEEQKTLDWLRNNIKTIPIQELTDKNLSIKQLLCLKPSEFQQAKTHISHVAVFQYSMTKKETGKEGKALYKFFVDDGEGVDPTSAEMKGFVHVVRAGELLIKLSYAFNRQVSISVFADILRSNAIPIKTMAELEGFKSLTDDLIDTVGVPYSFYELLQRWSKGQTKTIEKRPASSSRDSTPVPKKKKTTNEK